MGILVCGDLSLEKHAGFWVQDCSAAVQNILLTVHDLGLGPVWTGIHPLKDREEGCKNLFNLPEQISPLGYIVIGQPDQRPIVGAYTQHIQHGVHYDSIISF